MNMDIVKAFFRFLISKLFLINLALVILVGFMIPYCSLGALEEFTNNDSEDYRRHYIAVPNFIGVHMDNIDDFIGNKDLNYVINDSVYSDNAPAGSVISQNPDPHIETANDTIPSYVKPGRRIYLTVVKKTGEYKIIPDLLSVNNSKKLAKVKLEMLGFKVNFEPKAHKDNGRVLELKYQGKKIEAGTKLLKGSVIDIIYGSGGGLETVGLPMLVGETAFNAQQLLALSGLESEVVYENASEDSLSFVVYKQIPHPRDAVKGVPSGSSVRIMARKHVVVSDTTAVVDPL
jgi:eukaryotic-like serine/threonine-protein kinase